MISSKLPRGFAMFATVFMVAVCAILDALTVGQDKTPLTLMSCANVGSGKQTPSCIIPHFGKVSKHSVESSNNKHWRVFHKRVLGSYFANDALHFSPESAALAIKPVSVSGDTDVLAGEAAADDIHEAAPRLAVKGSHVIPDWEAWQDSVALSGEQFFLVVRFNLDSTDAGMSEKDSAEDSSAAASK